MKAPRPWKRLQYGLLLVRRQALDMNVEGHFAVLPVLAQSQLPQACELDVPMRLATARGPCRPSRGGRGRLECGIVQHGHEAVLHLVPGGVPHH